MSSQSPHTRFAYVWCIFGGNSYIAGVLPSAFSVKKTGTPHDLVCMYTNDVTDLDTLSNIFTKIVEVPLIRYRSKNMKTTKQREIYGDWIDKSYTKMNCLSLIEYTKILVMDADTITIKNIDHLFEFPAPAGTFSSPWGDRYKGFIPLGMYPDDHGKKVTSSMIDNALSSGGVVAIGTTMLLEPNKKDFDNYKYYVSGNQPYGFPRCNSGFDEQSISYFFSKIKGVEWTHIHQQYNFIPWKHNWLSQNKTPYLFHFFNKEKPWMLDPSEWIDLKVYYQTVLEMMNDDMYKLKSFEKYTPYLKKYISDEKKIMDTPTTTTATSISSSVSIRIFVNQKKGGIYTDALVIHRIIEKIYPGKSYITNDSGEMNNVELNIFIEHCIDNGCLPSKTNWLLVNPEFVTEWDLKFMKDRISIVLCKTKNSVDIMTYTKLRIIGNYDIEYIKFSTPETSEYETSEYETSEYTKNKDWNIVLHMAGSSFLKGTFSLLKSWVTYNLQSVSTLIISKSDGPGSKDYLQYWNELSPICISEWRGIKIDGEQYRNIIFTKYLDPEEKDKLYRIAGVYLCPSVAEGFGHYINEGRMTKSVVITTDSEPMNELIDKSNGVLIPVNYKQSIKNYIPWVKFLSSETKVAVVHEEEIIKKLIEVDNMSVSDKIKMGNISRERYERDTKFFEEKFSSLITRF